METYSDKELETMMEEQREKERKRIENLLDLYEKNPPITVEDYYSLHRWSFSFDWRVVHERLNKRYFEVVGPEKEHQNSSRKILVHEKLNRLYIEAVGPKKAFEIGSTTYDNGWSTDWIDYGLRMLALEVIYNSDPKLHKKILRREEKKKQAHAKYLANLPPASESLSDILGDVTPWGRRDRRTGLHMD